MIQPSRIHKLNGFGPLAYIKRDDELSFGISGSKLRKFQSLINELKSQSIECLYALGSASSNNLVGLAQVCNEHQIKFFPVVLKPAVDAVKSTNYLLLQTLIPESNFTYVDRASWNRAYEMALAMAQSSPRALVLDEGAFHPYAIDGAKSLHQEIVGFERSQGLFFRSIYVDAGTGLTAQVLIQSFQEERDRDRTVKVLLLSGTAEEFRERLGHVGCWMNAHPLCQFDLEKPDVGASFGSTPKAVLEEVIKVAREEGIITDPIYTAKLLRHYRRRAADAVTEPSLIIHSGGGFGLMGFLHRLS